MVLFLFIDPNGLMKRREISRHQVAIQSSYPDRSAIRKKGKGKKGPDPFNYFLPFINDTVPVSVNAHYSDQA